MERAFFGVTRWKWPQQQPSKGQRFIPFLFKWRGIFFIFLSNWMDETRDLLHSSSFFFLLKHWWWLLSPPIFTISKKTEKESVRKKKEEKKPSCDVCKSWVCSPSSSEHMLRFKFLHQERQVFFFLLFRSSWKKSLLSELTTISSGTSFYAASGGVMST